jgi:hypothetical protein
MIASPDDWKIAIIRASFNEERERAMPASASVMPRLRTKTKTAAPVIKAAAKPADRIALLLKSADVAKEGSLVA